MFACALFVLSILFFRLFSFYDCLYGHSEVLIVVHCVVSLWLSVIVCECDSFTAHCAAIMEAIVLLVFYMSPHSVFDGRAAMLCLPAVLDYADLSCDLICIWTRRGRKIPAPPR